MNIYTARTSEVLLSPALRRQLAEVWASSFGMLICEKCDSDILTYHKILLDMAKRKNPNREKKYLLKVGHHVDMYNRKIGRDEMTDEMAIEFLRRHPTAVKFFEVVPDDHFADAGNMIEEEEKPDITITYALVPEGSEEEKEAE